jgi:hypothetical protein
MGVFRYACVTLDPHQAELRPMDRILDRFRVLHQCVVDRLDAARVWT